MEAFEEIVEAQNLGPIGIFGAGRLTVQRGDRGLYGIRAGSGTKRLYDQRQGFGDLGLIPAAAILFFEDDDVAGRIEAGVAARVLEEHEGEQGGGLGGRLGSEQAF